MYEGTNERTYTTTKHITTLLLRSRVKMRLVKLRKSTVLQIFFFGRKVSLAPFFGTRSHMRKNWWNFWKIYNKYLSNSRCNLWVFETNTMFSHNHFHRPFLDIRSWCLFCYFSRIFFRKRPSNLALLDPCSTGSANQKTCSARMLQSVQRKSHKIVKQFQKIKNFFKGLLFDPRCFDCHKGLALKVFLFWQCMSKEGSISIKHVIQDKFEKNTKYVIKRVIQANVKKVTKHVVQAKFESPLQKCKKYSILQNYWLINPCSITVDVQHCDQRCHTSSLWKSTVCWSINFLRIQYISNILEGLKDILGNVEVILIKF